MPAAGLPSKASESKGSGGSYAAARLSDAEKDTPRSPLHAHKE